MSESIPERPYCLPGCDRFDGHDGRDAGACMGPGGEVLKPGPLDLVHRHPDIPVHVPVRGVWTYDGPLGFPPDTLVVFDATPEPIPDFPGFIASLLSKGYTRNPCRDNCQDKGAEHAHLRTPDGDDMITWADGRVSYYDLTQPARLIYPAAGRTAYAPSSLPKDCYQMTSGPMVHVKPGCRCKR